MASKKILFVIVEGPSDDTAIGAFFDSLFVKEEVHVEVMHCDILTDYLFNSKPFHVQRNKNILIELKKTIDAYLQNNRQFKKKDIVQIIHICDTDGCFSPDSVIEEVKSIKEPQYSEDKILVKDIDSFIKIKKFKVDNINKLINTQYIWNDIPYHIYYMSSSIDYVLYNKLNLTDEQKEDEAHNFVKTYMNDWESFAEFFRNSTFVVTGDYLETWDFIKKDLNSLKRYTNITLCFPTLKK